MKTQTTPKQSQNPAVARQPSEDEIRGYAYCLYEQGGHAHGHDVDHWLEAEACLRENDSKEGARPTPDHIQDAVREPLALMNHGLPNATQPRTNKQSKHRSIGSDDTRRSISQLNSDQIEKGLNLSPAPTNKIMKTDNSSKKLNPARDTLKQAQPKSPLFSSNAVAEREIAALRRAREERDAAPTLADRDARVTLF
jgi:hypothetical protein